MADEDTEKTASSLSVDDALKMYENYKSYWSDNYSEAKTDLNFYLGIDHWDAKDVAARTDAGKISLVINELPQFVHQVTNDIRQNVPSIKALPEADGDIETGKIYSGLFRAIEYRSHADEVCDTASEYAVKCSLGFMRIDHDYCDDESDEQEIIFKTVPDPLSVWLDPASVEYDGRDANGAIALEPINRKDFERLYPRKSFSSFTDPKGDSDKKDSIVLAEIFIREFSGRRGKKTTVRRYKFSGEDLLAETTFPGSYVPIVPIYGEVTWVDGKRILSSLIRQARDPQKRLNHWASKEAEILSMAPIAPVMAEEGTLVNERGQWQSPGSEMVLEYRTKNLDDEPVRNIPARLQPPPVPTGIINAMEGAKQNIKESMGLYNASIGQQSNEISGIAINARKTEGDVATFHFPDNVRRSYGHMGEIAIEMMPAIYDTPRIIQTLNDETDVEMIGINGAPMQPGQKQAYDLTKGKYRVRITTGASYTTKRQEEAAFLANLFQKDPALMQIGGDILFKSLDTPGAQALAARFKKTLPPQLANDQNQQDPQVIQLTQKLQQMDQVIQQGAQEIQQLQQQLQSKQGEEAAKQTELQLKGGDQQLKAQEISLKMQVEQLKLQNETLKLELEAEKIQLEREKIQLETMKAEQGKQEILAPAPAMEAPDGESPQELPEERTAKQSEMVLRAQQANAAIQGLDIIAQQLSQLTAHVAQPKTVVRDASGAIQGVR